MAYWQDKTYFDLYNAAMAPDWRRVDIRAWWTSPDLKWRVAVSVNNVTDEEGILNVIRDPSGRQEVEVMDPRRWFLELSYKF